MVTVRLRPLEEADLPVFEHAYSTRDGAGEHQWFGFSPPAAASPRWGRSDRTADG